MLNSKREGDMSEMTNEEYRMALTEIFNHIDDNKILRYFYIFVSEKLKNVQ